jgi:hypothetical protein
MRANCASSRSPSDGEPPDGDSEFDGGTDREGIAGM